MYNKHMGGVDLLDGLLGRYKIKMRSRKWYIRLFNHLLDVTIVNSWLLHRRINKQKGNTKTMTLVDFRTDLALSLCKNGQKITPKLGRPSIKEALIKKKRKTTGERAPTKSVQYDGIHHWPVTKEKIGRCKKPGCKSYTRMKCSNCEVTLCCGKNRTCFKEYHIKVI